MLKVLLGMSGSYIFFNGVLFFLKKMELYVGFNVLYSIDQDVLIEF